MKIRFFVVSACFIVAKCAPQNNLVEESCEFYLRSGYECVPSNECSALKCLETTDGDDIVVHDSSVESSNIRSIFSPTIPDDPCDNEEQMRILRTCPHERSAADERVCCQVSYRVSNNNIVATTNPPHAAMQGETVLAMNLTRTDTKNRKCGVRNNFIPRQVSPLENSMEGEWPHMCAVFKVDPDNKRNNIYLSGASLITPGVALTVAHYIYELKPNQLVVRCGIHNISSTDFVARDVSDISYHPVFNPRTLWNDFGLLHLDRDFELNEKIGTICLNSENDFDEKSCIATGWGKQFVDSDEFSAVLKQVDLPLVDNVECQSRLRQFKNPSFILHPSFICAGGNSNQDTCKGDGGSPLVCKKKDDNTYTQVGVVSWGIDCGKPDRPGVYASIAYGRCYVDWMTKCKHGNSYAEFINFQDCSGWLNEEKEQLEKLKEKYEKAKNSPNTKALTISFINKELPFIDGSLERLSGLESVCVDTRSGTGDLGPKIDPSDIKSFLID